VEGMILLLFIAALPLILFFGLISLAILIWSWGRIGRYLVNLGRWLGDWRNFFPLSILGILFLILMLIIFPMLGVPRMLMLVLLIPFLLVTLVIFQFAIIAWIVAGSGWFWPRWRRLVWSGFISIWGSLPSRSSAGRKKRAKPPERPSPGTQTPALQQTHRKGSMLGSFWTLMLGNPTKPTRAEPVPGSGPEPGTPPLKKKAPVKRSMLGNFWALMLGKPSKPAKPKAAPVRVQTTEQSLGQSETIATTAKTVDTTRVVDSSTSLKANKKAPAKRSWFGALWALMVGKRSKSGRPRPGPAGAKDSEQATRPSETSAAATAKTGATARVDEAATMRERAKKEKPSKRGFFAGIWTSIVRGVTFVVGLVFLGVVWVVQKIREGIEWIRVRLNLD
jgi:hypothetical protein